MFKPTKEDLERPVKVKDLIEFKDELGDFIVETVATKKELASLKDVVLKTQFELERKMDGMKDEFTGMKDQVLTSNDKVAHELKAMREEQSSHSGNHRDITDTTLDHERRIKRLEARAIA